MNKRIVVMGDQHTGHNVGLTSPDYQLEARFISRNNRSSAVSRKKCWAWFAKRIDALKPIDILLSMGDAIDGKGTKTGGSELAISNRVEQCKAAADVINYVGAKKVGMVYGTPYHTGKEEDWEDVVASYVDNLEFISGQKFPKINGVQFDIKHKVSSSSIPHGRMTALARAKMWNTIWHSEHEQQPKAHVIIRGHVHYHNYCGGDGWVAMSCPAMQGFGSKFGVRQCEGLAQMGFLVFDIDEKGDYRWHVELAHLLHMKARAYPL